MHRTKVYLIGRGSGEGYFGQDVLYQQDSLIDKCWTVYAIKDGDRTPKMEMGPENVVVRNYERIKISVISSIDYVRYRW
jgi:hypothetical protein